MQLRIGNFMYYFKKGFYMIRKNLHMKIKRIFCGILTAAMLLGQTGAVWAEATDTASESPTPTPDPHTEYYAQEADTDSIQGWPVGPKIEAGCSSYGFKYRSGPVFQECRHPALPSQHYQTSHLSSRL